ncbi:MAG: hypothetical protein C4575_09260 [Desulforudis sp.]|jgi:hypothetical protein|nr:MAG: hypothetical protein C4575_09260 [Desulforudis sp.]
MAEISSSYQPKVGLEQGGGRFFMKQDGEFKFWDQDFTGERLRNLILSLTTNHLIASAVTSGGAVSVLSVAYGFVAFSLGAGCSIGSHFAKYPVPLGSGAALVITGYGQNADAVVTLSDNSAAVAGAGLTCQVFGLGGIKDFSSILISANGYCRLVFYNNNAWAVVEHNANCTPRVAA